MEFFAHLEQLVRFGLLELGDRYTGPFGNNVGDIFSTYRVAEVLAGVLPDARLAINEALPSVDFPGELDATITTKTTTVRGYRVNLKYQGLAEAQQLTRRDAIHRVIRESSRRMAQEG